MSEKEVKVVAKALEARLCQALSAGRLSQVMSFDSNKKTPIHPYIYAYIYTHIQIC
jgi:hypothetical protein